MCNLERGPCVFLSFHFTFILFEDKKCIACLVDFSETAYHKVWLLSDMPNKCFKKTSKLTSTY